MDRLCGLVIALVLVSATACSDGSDGPDADRDAIRAGLAEVVAPAQPGPGDAEEGVCFADRLLGETTPGQLRDGGVLDASYHVVEDLPQLPEELAESWARAQLRCTDFVERSAQAQERISHGSVDASAYAACLHGSLTEEQLRAAVVDTLTGDWDGADLERLSAAQGDCARQSPR